MNTMFHFLVILLFSYSYGEKTIKSCRCLAHLDVTDGMSDANRLRTLDITKQIPDGIGCDNRGEFMCKALCKEIFKVESNDFDLDKPPNTNSTVQISLGQYLCDVLQKDISNVLLGITSELSCIESKDNSNTTSTLKIFMDKKLTCLNHKYIKQ